ncbi:hypothetical protein HPB49_002218 [Dermacentor silvarum]|uniref:Uncharacterized protein n=1 Tax=Dermacentor silvarum TaxID=543639 RepID=A0ACB8CP91_DERSI|nr:hypothetical protein HPB49_002218 [Dermacentor silvarum]
MKACRTNAADDALAAADADDEPVFRPLRRNNWTAFRKRGRRAAPDETARSAEEELNVAVISLPPSDGGCENEAFDATAAVQGSEEGPSQRALPPQRDANVGDDSEPPTYATALLMTSRALDLPCVCCCPVASPRGDAANHGAERGGVRPVPPESRDAREAPIREDAVGVSGVASSSSVAGRPAGPGIRAATLARHRNDVVVGATRLEPGPAPPPHHEVLPDILNAHLPPPYATLPPPPSSSARRHLPPPPRLRPPRCVVDTEVVEPKHCCGVLVTQTVSIRWFIVMIAFVGLCCAIVGTVLGALKATGREHLTVSLLMIGEYSASILFSHSPRAAAAAAICNRGAALFWHANSWRRCSSALPPLPERCGDDRGTSRASRVTAVVMHQLASTVSCELILVRRFERVA